MIPETLPTLPTPEDVCRIAGKWMLSGLLADKLLHVAAMLPFGVQIISGHRTVEQQEQLIADGRGAPVHLSTHTQCPSTGADLWPLIAVAPQVKVELGRAVQLAGLRWGGGSAADPVTGMPSDWNHVDLGPVNP